MRATSKERCPHCGAVFVSVWQVPPCFKDCPFHLAFRVREIRYENAVRRLSGPKERDA